MLRTLLPTAVDDAADRHRRVRMSTDHVRPLRGLIHYRIDEIEHEIHARVDDDGAVAEKRRAHRGTGACELRDRSIYDALSPEHLVEIGHGVADIPRAPQPLADHEHFGMPRQEVFECGADRAPIGQPAAAHRGAAHAKTRPESAEAGGNGACSARSHACSTVFATARRMDSTPSLRRCPAA